ncbi:glutaredoxin family protein [Agromyces atrinae]|uniref:Glutaredoxin n=1 Tax=Agromyces atrinae TaxID=592376 RepID=A0A4Q2MCI8_9MICO|nr:glutaredoxin family protein [Agromyces atrinae]NYD67377.1 glutaredoxin [Agromyces atrinae]RXZ86800.1 glutaredoxin family protein [Agromyces atrinae]
MTALTLIGKPGCHLCDDAREVVNRVLVDFPDVSVDEVSILDDDVLFERHVEEIPVVLIDGAVHTFWRVDENRLRAALTTAS